jgi:hypothetical protein
VVSDLVAAVLDLAMALASLTRHRGAPADAGSCGTNFPTG